MNVLVRLTLLPQLHRLELYCISVAFTSGVTVVWIYEYIE